jgi:hypothetical protein
MKDKLIAWGFIVAGIGLFCGAMLFEETNKVQHAHKLNQISLVEIKRQLLGKIKEINSSK